MYLEMMGISGQEGWRTVLKKAKVCSNDNDDDNHHHHHHHLKPSGLNNDDLPAGLKQMRDLQEPTNYFFSNSVMKNTPFQKAVIFMRINSYSGCSK
jgi:hypothetical protein